MEVVCVLEPSAGAVALGVQSSGSISRTAHNLEQHKALSFWKSFLTMPHPVSSSRHGLLLKENNGLLNQWTFPPRQFLGQLMAHAAL